MSTGIVQDGTMTTVKNEKYQDEMIEDLFSTEMIYFSDVDTCVEIMGTSRNVRGTSVSSRRSYKPSSSASRKAKRKGDYGSITETDNTITTNSGSIMHPMDEEIHNMVRADVRKMIAKLKTGKQQAKHKKEMRVAEEERTDKMLVRPGKYGECDMRNPIALARKQKYQKIKMENLKKKKKESLQNAEEGEGPLEQRECMKDQDRTAERQSWRSVGSTKQGYYKNLPEDGPEHISHVSALKGKASKIPKTNFTSNASVSSARKSVSRSVVSSKSRSQSRSRIGETNSVASVRTQQSHSNTGSASVSSRAASKSHGTSSASVSSRAASKSHGSTSASSRAASKDHGSTSVSSRVASKEQKKNSGSSIVSSKNQSKSIGGSAVVSTSKVATYAMVPTLLADSQPKTSEVSKVDKKEEKKFESESVAESVTETMTESETKHDEGKDELIERGDVTGVKTAPSDEDETSRSHSSTTTGGESHAMPQIEVSEQVDDTEEIECIFAPFGHLPVESVPSIKPDPSADGGVKLDEPVENEEEATGLETEVGDSPQQKEATGLEAEVEDSPQEEGVPPPDEQREAHDPQEEGVAPPSEETEQHDPQEDADTSTEVENRTLGDDITDVEHKDPPGPEPTTALTAVTQKKLDYTSDEASSSSPAEDTTVEDSTGEKNGETREDSGERAPAKETTGEEEAGDAPDDGTVELVLVDESAKLRQLEQEHAKLKDTVNFLRQTAVEKEKYFAELAWFGKRSEEEVQKWRPNFWRERLDDLGPEAYEEFRADAMRIADPDVGDWEHGFSSGALAMARLLLGISHAVDDEKICAFHDKDQPCTHQCVTCSVTEQRKRELADFPVLDP